MRVSLKKVFIYLGIGSLFWLVAGGLSVPVWAQVELAYKYTCLVNDPIKPEIFWLGAKGGIKSYDLEKKEWRFFSQPKEVNCLLVDTQNRNIIWAGTKNGLFLFSREKDQWQPANQHFTKLDSDKEMAAAFQSSEISAITLDPTNSKKVFLASARGLIHFDKETESGRFLTVADGLLEDFITCLAFDKALPQQLWLGSTGGLMSLDIKEWKVKRHLSQGEVPGDQIHTLAINQNWILVNNPNGGIAGYNKERDYWDYYVPYENLPLTDYQILTLFNVNDNNSPKLLVGTRSFGVIVFDEVTKVSSRLEEKGLSVTAFALNPKEEGQFWFTIQVCSGGGVGYYSFPDKTWWTTYPLVVLEETYPVIWKEVQKDK